MWFCYGQFKIVDYYEIGGQECDTPNRLDIGLD